MFRLVFLILFLSGSVMAQGISIGVHGCGSWLKGEIEMGDESYDSEDTESIYGFGADVSIRPTLSPIGLEVGFTYLSKSDESEGYEATIKGHPLYLNGTFHINPMIYVLGGVNYTFWSVEADGESFDDIDGKLGFQGGVGVEIGAGNLRLYGTAMYFIQKGEVSEIPDLGITLDEKLKFKSKGLQVRAGVRFGG